MGDSIYVTVDSWEGTRLRHSCGRTDEPLSRPSYQPDTVHRAQRPRRAKKGVTSRQGEGRWMAAAHKAEVGRVTQEERRGVRERHTEGGDPDQQFGGPPSRVRDGPL